MRNRILRKIKRKDASIPKNSTDDGKFVVRCNKIPKLKIEIFGSDGDHHIIKCNGDCTNCILNMK